MQRVYIRRYHRPSFSKEGSTLKRKGQKEETFFGASAHEPFFQRAAPILQRKNAGNEETEKQLQRIAGPEKQDEKKLMRVEEEKKEKLQKKATEAPGEISAPVTSARVGQLNGGGQPLPKQEQLFFGQRMGVDFSKVRIHTGADAARSANSLNAKAYTLGPDIVFAEGAYNPSSAEGKKLLAHELAHVVQQGESSPAKIQRAVRFNVLDWDASAINSPTPQNAGDPRMILIPSQDQILISGLIETNGAAGDPCTDYEFGTTQTAWMAWVHIYFRGRTAAEGSVVVRYNAAVPMRDPGVRGNIWYDNGRVRSPAACGDSIGIFHNDGPWHTISKAVHNSSVAGSPLNYLTGYTRGLHLVTYLTAKRKGGAYLASPLKFRYWNSIQDFSFTPNYAAPLSAWAFAGAVRVNIGSQGNGETADAPYYTSAGTKYNDHFNNPGNWSVIERR